MKKNDGEFRIVVRNNKSNRRKSYLIKSEEGSVTGVLGDKLRQRLSEIQLEITCEDFYPDLLDLLKKRAPTRLVCLGLGHFSSCPIARVQLGFLLAVSKSISFTAVVLQDPAFTAPEITFLQSLGFQVLADNLEGRFRTESGHRVLYYLPHCPKTLTNNLLATNWTRGRLTSSIIICNSFQALLVSTLERDIQAEASYVRKIAEYITEIPLRVSERNFDSFNDTSVHLFEPENIDDCFWKQDGEEAQTVGNNDVELISKKIEEKLNI